MSFDRSVLGSGPTLETHVPVTVHIPDPPKDGLVGRPDFPVPSLWQKSVKAVRKLDGREVVVVVMDHATMMFRPFWPDEGEIDLDEAGIPIVDEKTGIEKRKGRFGERTEWEHCKDYNVAVTYSPREIEKQKAKRAFEEALKKLDQSKVPAYRVLCADDDPANQLAKLEALQQLGIIAQSLDAKVVNEAVEQDKAKAKETKR